MNSRVTACSFAALLGAAVPAQTVLPTTTATTTATMSVSASSGGVTHTASLPAGPIAQPNLCANVFGTGTSGAAADLSWANFATPTRMLSVLAFDGSITGPAAGAVSGHATDVVVFFSLPQSAAVRIEMTLALSVGAGATVPTMRVDVHNDGTFELTEASVVPHATMFTTFGPAPTPVRLQIDAALTAPGAMSAYLMVEVLPGPQTVVTNVLSGCLGEHLPLPRFDGGVDLDFFHQSALIEVGVIGFGPQPLLLGTLAPTLPCILFPSPDVLFVNQSLTLPLPLAVRPVSFWTQNVTLMPSGLTTSDAFRVDAL